MVVITQLAFPCAFTCSHSSTQVHECTHGVRKRTFLQIFAARPADDDEVEIYCWQFCSFWNFCDVGQLQVQRHEWNLAIRVLASGQQNQLPALVTPAKFSTRGFKDQFPTYHTNAHQENPRASKVADSSLRLGVELRSIASSKPKKLCCSMPWDSLRQMSVQMGVRKAQHRELGTYVEFDHRTR